jgi:DNA-directed RNA polymerase specialized sigma24 family protein
MMRPADPDPVALARAADAPQRMPVQMRRIFIASQVEGLSFRAIARREQIGLWRVRRQMRGAIAIIDRDIE